MNFKKLLFILLAVLIALFIVLFGYDSYRMSQYKIQAKKVREDFLSTGNKESNRQESSSTTGSDAESLLYIDFNNQLMAAKKLDDDNKLSSYIFPWSKSKAQDIEDNTSGMENVVRYYKINLDIDKSLVEYNQQLDRIKGLPTIAEPKDFIELTNVIENIKEYKKSFLSLNESIKSFQAILSAENETIDLKYSLNSNESIIQYLDFLVKSSNDYKEGREVDLKQLSQLSKKALDFRADKINQEMEEAVKKSVNVIYAHYLEDFNIFKDSVSMLKL